jgi:CDGSH iron-sulfur domain-containing protein 3
MLTQEKIMRVYDKGSPHAIEVKAGKTVYLCQCNQTATPPFCDGSHMRLEGVQARAYTPDKDGTVYFCGCGRSANMPLCDGSHND